MGLSTFKSVCTFLLLSFLAVKAFVPRMRIPQMVQNGRLYSGGDVDTIDDRKKLWRQVSQLEKEAVELLSICKEEDEDKKEEALEKLAQSVVLKNKDPFIELANSYSDASVKSDEEECKNLLNQMEDIGLPPHLESKRSTTIIAPSTPISEGDSTDNENAAIDTIDLAALSDDNIDLSSTFSDTVTEKIRVKVNSFYDSEKSDPANGKFMFWYKVAIYNEGPEPVQIVARMWDIEKVGGTKETVRGAGVMSTQPIIPAGDMFTYQSVCPLKVFPPEGKRVLGSMSGAYTICKGNMGQVNFSVKVGKFMLILPEDKVNGTDGN